MELQIIAVGKKMPAWCGSAFTEYAHRFPRDFKLSLVEVAPAIRTKSQTAVQYMQKEAQAILAQLNSEAMVIALDVKGKSFNTDELSDSLGRWREQTKLIQFLIGGPDGLASECLAQADLKWSLSALTFPHPLARVIVAEQLYRAWSILNNHPYHRAG